MMAEVSSIYYLQLSALLLYNRCLTTRKYNTLNTFKPSFTLRIKPAVSMVREHLEMFNPRKHSERSRIALAPIYQASRASQVEHTKYILILGSVYHQLLVHVIHIKIIEI